jgi:hypothetical protein
MKMTEIKKTYYKNYGDRRILYRYEFRQMGECFDEVELLPKIFYVFKKTDKGFWISYSNTKGKKWVNNYAKKRFAYPTKKQALNNFIKRKERYRSILIWNIKQINSLIKLAKKEEVGND